MRNIWLDAAKLRQDFPIGCNVKITTGRYGIPVGTTGKITGYGNSPHGAVFCVVDIAGASVTVHTRDLQVIK